jgi:hypothetical protein
VINADLPDSPPALVDQNLSTPTIIVPATSEEKKVNKVIDDA